MIDLRLRFGFAAAVLALASCSPRTETDVAAAEGLAPPWAFETSDVPVDTAVRYGALDNGMRYAILANDTPSGTAAIRLRFDVGSLMEADDQRGLAHMLEHMMFNGSENVPEGEMVKILERAGLAFGPDTNAYTNFDETVYQLDLPDVSDETFDTAFFILRETASRALIAPDAVDRERGVVLSELRAGDTYQRRARDALWGYLYPDALFPKRMPIGVSEVLTTAPAARVRDLYETYYRPERTVLVAVGDFDADAIEARIRATFADWEPARPDGPDAAAGTVTPRPRGAGVFVHPEQPTNIAVNVMRPGAFEPDTLANRRKGLVRSLGFAMFNRRLQRLARETDAVFLSGGASYGLYFDAIEQATLNMVSEPQAWPDALAVGEQELRRALEYGFSQPELDEQIASYRASYEAAAEGAETRRTEGLADRIVGDAAAKAVTTDPRGDLERFEALASAVALDEVEAAFREVWGDEEPLLFLSTNAPVDGGEATVLAAYDASRAVPIAAASFGVDEDFAYTNFGPPGAVATETHVDDLDFTEFTFANNVRLNVKTTDFEDDRVRVSVRVGRGGLEMPKDAPGVEWVADNAFITGGLEAHSFDDMQTLLAGDNVGFGFQVQSDAFAFGAVTTPGDLALQLQIFAAYVAAPGFREEALARYRRSLEVWYDTLDATPAGVASRDIPRLIARGDPRFGVPSKEELMARTLEEAHAAMADALDAGAIEVALVGDVSVEDAVAAVAATFGALPPRAVDRAYDASLLDVRFPDPVAEPVRLEHAGEATRALIYTYWPSTDDRDTRLSAAVSLLRSVMDLKLNDRVREADGATYSPRAGSTMSPLYPGYGYLFVSLDLAPNQVDAYFGVIDEIAAALAAGDISEDELQRARQPMLEDLEEAEESNTSWINLLYTAQTKPRYLDVRRTYRDLLAGLTVADVTAAAEAYLDPAKAYRIAILPGAASGGGGDASAE